MKLVSGDLSIKVEKQNSIMNRVEMEMTEKGIRVKIITMYLNNLETAALAAVFKRLSE